MTDEEFSDILRGDGLVKYAGVVWSVRHWVKHPPGKSELLLLEVVMVDGGRPPGYVPMRLECSPAGLDGVETWELT